MLPYEGFLWIIRVGAARALVVHVTPRSRSGGAPASPHRRYVVKKNNGVHLLVAWMRWGGVTLLLFLVWHLLDFTVPKVNVRGGRPTTPTTWWSTRSTSGG